MASLSLQCDQDLLVLVVCSPQHLEACQAAAQSTAQNVVAVNPSSRAAIVSWPFKPEELPWTSREADLRASASKLCACRSCPAPEMVLERSLTAVRADVLASRTSDAPVSIRVLLISDQSIPVATGATPGMETHIWAEESSSNAGISLERPIHVAVELASLPGMASILHMDSLVVDFTSTASKSVAVTSDDESQGCEPVACSSTPTAPAAAGRVFCSDEAVSLWYRHLEEHHPRSSARPDTSVVDAGILRLPLGPRSLCLRAISAAELWDACAALTSHPLHRSTSSGVPAIAEAGAACVGIAAVGIGSLAWQFSEHRKAVAATGGPSLPLG